MFRACSNWVSILLRFLCLAWTDSSLDCIVYEDFAFDWWVWLCPIDWNVLLLSFRKGYRFISQPLFPPVSKDLTDFIRLPRLYFGRTCNSLCQVNKYITFDHMCSCSLEVYLLLLGLRFVHLVLALQ